MTITAFNPVYFNAAYSAFMKAALRQSGLASPPPSNPTQTAAQLLAQVGLFVPAAVAFAQQVDTALSSQNATQWGHTYDPEVASAANTTIVPATAAEANGLASRVLAVSNLCDIALTSASADNGLQGGSGASPPATPHTPVPSDYTALAAGVAIAFAAYIAVGQECIT